MERHFIGHKKENIYKENDIINLKKFLSNPDDWRKDNA